METHTQGREMGKTPVLVGNEVIHAGKQETGTTHHGATFSQTAVPDAYPPSTVAAPGLIKAPVAVVAAPKVILQPSAPIIVNGIGLTRQERLSALERHLDRPIPHATEFYLIDKIDRLCGHSGQFLELQDLIAHAANPGQMCPFRLGMVLGSAVRAGALEKLGTQTGRNGSYRITQLGKRYLEQAKAMRVALWKINPRMDIAEICAIVQMEGGDTLSEMVSKVADQDFLEKERRRQEKRAAKKHGANAPEQASPAEEQQASPREPPQPAQLGVHALWAGLLAPTQHDSFSEPETPPEP